MSDYRTNIHLGQLSQHIKRALHAPWQQHQVIFIIRLGTSAGDGTESVLRYKNTTLHLSILTRMCLQYIQYVKYNHTYVGYRNTNMQMVICVVFLINTSQALSGSLHSSLASPSVCISCLYESTWDASCNH